MDDSTRSERHALDPVSGALGVATVGAGLAVAAGTDLGVHDLGWAVALGAILLGATLLPWRR